MSLPGGFPNMNALAILLQQQQQQQQQQQHQQQRQYMGPQQHQQQQMMRGYPGMGLETEMMALQKKYQALTEMLRAEQDHEAKNIAYVQTANDQQVRQNQYKIQLDDQEKAIAATQQELADAEKAHQAYDATVANEEKRVAAAQEQLQKIRDTLEYAKKRASAYTVKPAYHCAFPHSREKQKVTLREAKMIYPGIRYPSTFKYFIRSWVDPVLPNVVMSPEFKVVKGDVIIREVEPVVEGVPPVVVKVLLLEGCSAGEHPHHGVNLWLADRGIHDWYTGVWREGDGAQDNHNTHCAIARRALLEQGGLDVDEATQMGRLLTVAHDTGSVTYYLMLSMAKPVTLHPLAAAETPDKPHTTPASFQLGFLLGPNTEFATDVTLVGYIIDELFKKKCARQLTDALKRLPPHQSEASSGAKRKREEAGDDEEDHGAKRGHAEPDNTQYTKITKTVTASEVVDCKGLLPFLYLDKPVMANARLSRTNTVSSQDVIDLLLSENPDFTYGELLELVSRVNGLNETTAPYVSYRQPFTQHTSEVSVTRSDPLPEYVVL